MRPGIVILVGAALVGSIWASFQILPRDDAAVARGRVLYDANCATCHGKTLEGEGDWRSPGSDGRYPAPPHDASSHTRHHSDTVLIAYITLGGEAALAKMGVAFDSGMPGFGDVLRQEDVADILAYIKSHWPERERLYQVERSVSDRE